ncbi:hypothetical protein SISSUDRAFT_984734 [Sistotremastrum suecicum HHB10207 ss-3]|uniref:Uncharacterized protein n=1 Tax=Sistotremastrum suecicum HHB10207 ss-3 TaxID=1314776 RepID=A0A166EDI6_9AGAM|nr:hypothetical protein SISSUDRAFT_984734 [Sistotremastrum suecicum HHB10207 ss-3]
MVIVLDEKLPPPPPYQPADPSPRTSPQPPPFNRGPLPRATFADLPPHILLHIVHSCFPSSDSDGGAVEQARKVLYWMAVCLRLVNRQMYTACMNVLRSTYLPSYTSMVRPPYTSDPFPMSASSDPGPNGSPLNSIQRETAVLDLYLSAKAREDLWLDDTELHLEREETFKDLFDLNQPRARIEDLVRYYGARSGVISSFTPNPSSPTSPTDPSSASASHSSHPPSPSGSSAPPQPSNPGIPFSSLSISFSPRRVALLYASSSQPGRKRTIAEADRARDEKLEHVAKRLVKILERERERKGMLGG